MSTRILAIESSCDETAAAVVEDGRRVLSSAVHSQIDLHAVYGGVVPEIAGRAHVMSVWPVTEAALRQADVTLGRLDAVAVTHGPGLVGALLCGVSFAKALAYGAGLPLVPVHHIEGHVSANFITHPALEPPFLCLVASGGHSHILRVKEYGVYELIGQTHDDAAGEAFDKAARVLSLPYPGGPLLDKLAEEGDPRAFRLPRAHMDGAFDFSFSGIKTAFINLAHTWEQRGEALPRADMAASFRAAVVGALVHNTIAAARHTGDTRVALAGGVAANALLRREMTARCEREGLRLYMPSLELCGDNAAMIGSAAYYRFTRGQTAPLSLNAQPALRLV